MNQNSTTLKSTFLAVLILIISLNVSATTTTGTCALDSNPITFVVFNANVNTTTNNILLNWVSNEEANTTPIEVERSFNGKDFKSIGIVLDGFSKGTQMEYAFKDNSPLLKNKAAVYYRLKQVSTDGIAYYSDILTQQLAAKK
jgi:trimeric autotransporter adhesin